MTSTQRTTQWTLDTEHSWHCRYHRNLNTATRMTVSALSPASLLADDRHSAMKNITTLSVDILTINAIKTTERCQCNTLAYLNQVGPEIRKQESIICKRHCTVQIKTGVYHLSIANVSNNHRPLKIRTDGSHARVHELGSIGVFGFLWHFCQKWSICYKIWYTWCHGQHEHFKILLGFITSSPWAVTLSWRKPGGRSDSMIWFHDSRKILHQPAKSERVIVRGGCPR